MKNIKILDCTLRDGGRIIDCKFPDSVILDISKRLSNANIDIIEIGFLRDWRECSYCGNSTFFTHVDQIRPFIPHERGDSLYVAFVDYGMFDFDSLNECDGTSVDGIRVGFTKKKFMENSEDIVRCLKSVVKKGYKLFVQGVNSLSYTDEEMRKLICLVNGIKPYSFGIVDTYGAMYVDDVRRIFNIVDKNLADDINIDFHSHNNFQLSFALAQEVITLSEGKRKIIIDATLNGMGKCAGNLNTELIVDFLARKMGYAYEFDMILDIIDEHMYSIKKMCTWGYSIPAVMAGIYKSHPNNVIYLTEKYRLATKDIRHIISMIDPEVRQRYDYDNIQKLYLEYNHTKVEDSDGIIKLHELLDNRNILVLSPGSSINKYENIIKKYIEDNNAFVIATNFVSKYADRDNRLTFFGSEKRYKHALERRSEKNIVIVSNILNHDGNEIIINYESLIERENEDFDNSMIMLLNLLRRLKITHFAIAGFDGYIKGDCNYFDEDAFEGKRFEEKYDRIIHNMDKMLKKYVLSMDEKSSIRFLTPSIYEDIFK